MRIHYREAIIARRSPFTLARKTATTSLSFRPACVDSVVPLPFGALGALIKPEGLVSQQPFVQPVKATLTMVVASSTFAEPTALVHVQDLIDSYDWEQSSLASRDKWPFAVNSSINLCCGLCIPIVVYLGDRQGMIPNDA